jgi:hypothetical protein
MTLTNVTVTGNSAYTGGGINCFMNVNTSVMDSTISGNLGGGIKNGTISQMSLIGTTVSGNTKHMNAGGILNDYYSTLTLTNSTVSGNSATLAADETGLVAGGIYNRESSTLNLYSSTVAGNTADGSLGGGGIVNDARSPWSQPTTVYLLNSIVAENSVTDPDGGPDLFTDFPLEDHVSGVINSQFSLIGIADDMGDASTFHDHGGNLLGTADSPIDPMLGLLADNGGPTLTHALLPGSPAIDAGDDDLVPLDVAFDQRGPGFDRIAGDSVDMGAFELSADVPSDVMATVKNTATHGRVLVLQGGSADDHILVKMLWCGQVFVAPSAGSSTTINGSSEGASFRHIDNITIDLGAGNDTVIATGNFLGRGMRALLGDGDDTFLLKCAALDILQVDSGKGDDTVQLDHVLVIGDTLIRTGAGEDEVTLDWAAILGSTNINLGEDDDALNVIDSLFGGDALADGGLGDDLLSLLGKNLFLASREARNFE